jgi:hypothetical protein
VLLLYHGAVTLDLSAGRDIDVATFQQMAAQKISQHPDNVVILASGSSRILPPMSTAGELQSDNLILLNIHHVKENFIILHFRGDQYLVGMESHDLVITLKIRIRELLRIPVSRQKISKDNVVLEDWASVMIGAHLLLEEAGESGLSVNVVVGDNIVKVPIDGGNQLVSDIKFFVSSCFGLKMAEFEILVPGRRFEEDDWEKTLWELGIHGKAPMFAVPRGEDVVDVWLGLEAGEVMVELERGDEVKGIKEVAALLNCRGIKNPRLFAGEKLVDAQGNHEFHTGDKVIML